MTRKQVEVMVWVVVIVLVTAGWLLLDPGGIGWAYAAVAAGSGIARLARVMSGRPSKDEAAAERWTLNRLRRARDKRNEAHSA